MRYDAGAAAYDRFVGRWSRLYAVATLEAAGVKASDRVLDLATGTGDAALLAIQHLGPYGTAVGVDLSLKELPADRDELLRPFALAAGYKLPTIYISADFATAGGLMSYGPDPDDLWRQAGLYAARILKGAKPANLPVEQPTKFELVLNLRTAKAIGLTIPPSLLQRADQAID